MPGPASASCPTTRPASTASPSVACAKAVPRQQAGIQQGDVILVLNGIRVTDAQSYTEALDEQKVGATVPVQILRGSEKLELKVTIGTRRR